jgi:DnaJ-class molecular chaperone
MTNRPTITLRQRPELDGDRPCGGCGGSGTGIVGTAACIRCGGRGDEPRRPRLTLAEIEHEYIEQTLSELGGNMSQTAAVLGIDRRTLYRKLNEAHPKGRLTKKLRKLRDDYAANPVAIQEVE